MSCSDCGVTRPQPVMSMLLAYSSSNISAVSEPTGNGPFQLTALLPWATLSDCVIAGRVQFFVPDGQTVGSEQHSNAACSTSMGARYRPSNWSRLSLRSLICTTAY